jgi:SAM-dependent methyltransferase
VLTGNPPESVDQTTSSVPLVATLPRVQSEAAVVEATLANTLESLDDAANYRNWILDLARPHLEAPVLEVGAGHGTFTESLVSFGRVAAVEPGAHAGGVLSNRFADDERVDVTVGLVDDVAPEPEFGSAIMINVLEHIADDRGALESILTRLQPGGRVVVWVPAFAVLHSDFDDKLGHERRYRLGALEELVQSAGYDVVDSRYVNFPGWFSWLLMVRLLKIEPTSPTTVRIFDRWIVPIVRRVEHWVRPAIGQSIFLVARKPLTSR